MEAPTLRSALFARKVSPIKRLIWPFLPMQCQRCAKEAIISLAYGPHHFCREHFEYFFEKRVRNVTRIHEFFEEGEKIAIAVSGGKDSVVTLNLIRQIMPRHEIVGISIDEGIQGYRNKAIDEAIKNYNALDIDYKIIKYEKEIGNSMQEIVQKTHMQGWKENSCTFCGVFRRKYINQAALEMGADKLVTGHNLDDEVQSICMNFFTDNLERLARLGPRIQMERIPGFVPRVKPLYTSPEEEVELFAQLKNYPHYNDTCCPFSHGADRNIYRMMVDMMEAKKPGTKNGIIRSFLNLKPHLQNIPAQGKFQPCTQCGDLTSQKICQACVFETRIREVGKLPQLMTPQQINAMAKETTSAGLPMYTE